MSHLALFDRIGNTLTGRRNGVGGLVKRLLPTPAEKKAWLRQPPAPSSNPAPTADNATERWQALVAEITPHLQWVDQRYQGFVQTKVNPLFGRLRNQQQQLLSNHLLPPLSPQEQAINRYFAASLALLGTAVVGTVAYPVLALPVIVTGVFLSYPLYRTAYLEWKEHRRIRLIHLGTVTNLVLWLGGYYAWGAFGIAFWQFGQKMLVMTQEQAHSSLIDVLRLQPELVWVRVNGLEVETPFAQVQVGDTLVLHAGQVIPVDGTVLTGAATVDQHMLTGESQPAEKSVGDPVLAATVVLSGMMDVRVEKTRDETMAAQIGQILNQATAYQVAYQANVLEKSQKYVLPIVGISLASLPFIGPAPAVALMAANYLPSMQMFGPGLLWGFLNIASSGGVLIKDGGALEQLKTIDTVVFDKTGTLTLDQPQLAEIYPFNGWSEADVLYMAAAAEARQTHPIARAILSAAAARELIPPAIEQAHYEVGYGIKVQVASGQARPTMPRSATAEPMQLVRVGSVRFMTMEGVTLPEGIDAVVAASQAQGHSVVMVAVDEQVVGCLALAPTVRSEARQIVDQLRQRGLALYIISGDQEAPTRQLAEQLGMTGYFANTLPTQKAELVEKLQTEGRKVCFVGDGINDTIAMRKAAVSISLCGATTAATDTAKIVLMDGDLAQLGPIFALADQFETTMSRLTRNLAGFSLLTATGLLFLHFNFGLAMLLSNVAVGTSLGISFHPLYNNPMTEKAALPDTPQP